MVAKRCSNFVQSRFFYYYFSWLGSNDSPDAHLVVRSGMGQPYLRTRLSLKLCLFRMRCSSRCLDLSHDDAISFRARMRHLLISWEASSPCTCLLSSRSLLFTKFKFLSLLSRDCLNTELIFLFKNSVHQRLIGISKSVNSVGLLKLLDPGSSIPTPPSVQGSHSNCLLLPAIVRSS